MFQTENLKAFEENTHWKNGAYHWNSNGNPVPLHVFEENGFSVPQNQENVVDEHARRWIAEYRESMKNYVPSAEEMFEMRAAFGEGETVVNVITGRKIQL